MQVERIRVCPKTLECGNILDVRFLRGQWLGLYRVQFILRFHSHYFTHQMILAILFYPTSDCH